MIVQPRNTKTLPGGSGRTVSGITIKAVMTALNVATALRVDDFLGENIMVRCWLIRNGQQKQICNTNLKVLAMASSIGTALAKYQAASNAAGAVVVLLKQDVAVQEIGMIPMLIDFTGPINLGKSDQILCEIVSNGTEYDSTSVDTSASFLQVDFVEASGVEIATPSITVKSVDPNEQNQNFDAGDNASRIVFINFNKATQLTADQVLATSSIESTAFRTSDNYLEAYTKTISRMNGFDAGFVDQNLILMALPYGEVTQKCSANLSFNSANVSGSSNYVVMYRMQSSAETLRRAQTIVQQRRQNNMLALS